MGNSPGYRGAAEGGAKGGFEVGSREGGEAGQAAAQVRRGGRQDGRRPPLALALRVHVRGRQHVHRVLRELLLCRKEQGGRHCQGELEQDSSLRSNCCCSCCLLCHPWAEASPENVKLISTIKKFSEK